MKPDPIEIMAQGMDAVRGPTFSWPVNRLFASAASAALTAAGLRIMPVEPTEAMLDAIAGTSFANLPSIKQRAVRNAYRAVLAAAGGRDE